ncbi:MASE3 domain-containing protein [Thiohalomonas denitrificans]|uniref:histidine kinase n=1 Tax=Thiohalomonas denitrificans TaxID=415747 RepID=A0A1G5PKF1_9GAMM|nr:MASE3 domain-containing protein [Thiohalomonas denitrificans]SCZ49651.1 PAS domain S-box-containing protein [Thiohalomonas denitrificans]
MENRIPQVKTRSGLDLGFGIWGLLLMAGLLISTVFYNYLLFHTLAELFAVIVAILLAVVGWQTYPFSRNGFLMFLAAGYFWVGILDLLHTLSYEGVGIIEPDAANISTQLWVATRYLEAVILLAAPVFAVRVLHRGPAFAAIGAAAAVVSVLIFAGVFPDAFVAGVGLTQFKILSEYIIIGLLIVALWHLWIRRGDIDRRVTELMALAIIVTAVSEFLFTLYQTVYGLENFVGHIGKVLSYWLVFVAIVETSLHEPFRMLSRGATTYDAVPDPVVVVDPDGVIRQTNRAARAYAGGAQLVGQSCHRLLHPQQWSAANCPICRGIRGELRELMSFEVPFRDSGIWHSVTITPIEQSGGAVQVGVVHVSHDITVRKQAEESLRRKNVELRSILQSVGDGIFGVDRRGKTVFVNPALEQLTGWSSEALIGRNAHTTLHQPPGGLEEHSREACAVLLTLKDGRTRHSDDDLFHRRDGAAFPVAFTSAPLRGNDGDISGAVVVFRDISERKRIEHERQRHEQKLESMVAERTRELQELNREMETFSYSVSHDLRAPLRAVNGFGQALLEDYSEQLEGTAKDYLGRMRDASIRMGQMIDGLLGLSRVSRREIHPEAADISSLAAELSELVTASDPRRRVEWRIEPGMVAYADPILLRLLLQNLLENAWKFTAERDPAVIEVGRMNTGEGVAFFVRDNGIGFEPEVANSLYQPFQRLHRGKQYEGSGIGLATVQRIVHRHFGRTWAEGKPGKGATFFFTLPVGDENIEESSNLY